MEEIKKDILSTEVEKQEGVDEETILQQLDAEASIIPTRLGNPKKEEPGVYSKKQKFIRYPQRLNKKLDTEIIVPNEKIYLPYKKSLPNLPDGVITETEYVTMNIVLALNGKDYIRLKNIIKKQEKSYRIFVREAIIAYLNEIYTLERVKEEELNRMAKAEALAEVEAVLMKRLEMRRLLWEPRYGKKGQYLKKGTEEIDKKNAERLGMVEELEDYEKEEQDKMIGRLKNTDIWAPKFTKKPPAFKGAKKNNDDELEQEADTKTLIPVDNYALEVKTEGVLPQEKGLEEEEVYQSIPRYTDDIEDKTIPQDSDASEAPSEEEMMT